MKIRRSLVSLIAAVGILPLFTGCGISADFWHEAKYSVDMPEGGETSVPGKEELVDLGSKSEIKDKLDVLQEFDISEIWIEIPSVDATNKATTVSGTLKVKGPNEGDEWLELGKYENVKVEAGAKLSIVPDEEQLAKVRDWALKAPHKFSVIYTGSVDQLPAKFETKARLHLVAKVGLF